MPLPNGGRLTRAWRVATFGMPHAKRRLAVLAVLGAAGGFAEAAVVVLVIGLVSRGQLARYPLAARLPDSTWALAGLALGAVAVLAAAHLGAARLAARASADVQRNVQTTLVGAYLDAPWPAQAATRTGDLQELVTVKVMLLAYGAQEAAQGFAALVNLAVVVAAAFVLSAYAAAALLAAVASVLALSRPFRARRRRLIDSSVDSSTGIAVEVTETAALAREYRVFGSTPAARERLERMIHEGARRMEAARVAVAASAPLLRDGAVALVVVGLAVVVARSDVGFATLSATVVLMLRALGHAQALASLNLRLEERTANLARLEASLAAWRPRPARGVRPCPRVESLTLREVGYTHPGGERAALENVSLELRRGELVGIVGRTGAGKSTLAALVLGLVGPDAGDVTVNGVPLDEIDPAQWHSRTAWVGQEPRLLTGTVAENVRFLREGLTDAAVAEAAAAAGLSRELATWRHGLGHQVGPHGSALSGGERQRVALARALAGQPDVLVLDEPTSALDAHAEAGVRQAVERVRHGLIVVVIAHRLSTVRSCDRIVVLDEGRLAAVAAPRDLERENSYFREVLALSGV